MYNDTKGCTPSITAVTCVISGDANITGGKPTFSIYLGGAFQATHHRSYELPSNTILGYACYEMTYDSAMGTFELVLPDEKDAGQVESNGKRYHVFDEPDGQNGKLLLFLTLWTL